MVTKVLLGAIIVLIIAYIWCGFKIVSQNNEGLVETLGKYSKTVKAGFIFIWPLLNLPIMKQKPLLPIYIVSG